MKTRHTGTRAALAAVIAALGVAATVMATPNRKEFSITLLPDESTTTTRIYAQQQTTGVSISRGGDTATSVTLSAADAEGYPVWSSGLLDATTATLTVAWPGFPQVGAVDWTATLPEAAGTTTTINVRTWGQ